VDLRRLSDGVNIAGGAAILLFVSMFFDWFGSKDSGELRLFSVGRNAWEALDVIPIILMVAIVAALVVALRLTDSAHELPVSANAVVAILGGVSALLILFRIVDPPDFGSLRDTFGTVPIEGTVQPPIFLALVAAVGIAFGGYRALREEKRLAA
jgi:amino acid transporter